MFTPAQVSSMLDIPASTLRRYAVQFSEYLSASANQKRRRSYTQGDILVLGKIRELTGQGLPVEDIAGRLPMVDNEPPEKSALALVPDIASELAHAQTVARNALQLVQELTSQVEKIPDIENRIAALADSLEGERAARLQLENELREYRDRPWYKRVFRG
jgi:DNA-binding transcriptional MerR regulator